MPTQSDIANDTLQQKNKQRSGFSDAHLVAKALKAEGVVTLVTLGGCLGFAL